MIREGSHVCYLNKYGLFLNTFIKESMLLLSTAPNNAYLKSTTRLDWINKNVCEHSFWS